MRTYILKRLLLMIPTLFGVTLINFTILNLAPGSPAQLLARAEQGESVDAATSKEAIRIFREQWRFNKPILWNLRPFAETAEIEGMLRATLGGANAERIVQQEALEDFGDDAVPHLVRILRGSDDPDLRRKAVELLSINALVPLRRVRRERGREDWTPEQQEILAANHAAQVENGRLRRWRYAEDASDADREEMDRNWVDWYAANEERFRYDAAGKVTTFLFDTRYGHYMKNLLTGDLGNSILSKRPVLQEILSHLRFSVVLSILSIIITYIIAVPIGIYSAVRQNTLSDRVIAVGLFMLYSLPSFFVGTLLLEFLTTGDPYWKVFPSGGFHTPEADLTLWEYFGDVAFHITLPLICLTYASFAALSRYARVGLLEVIRSDYIRTARAKGLSEGVVILKHALRNGMIPLITLMAGLLPTLIGGAIIVEYLFNIPGIGQFEYSAIQNRDYNVIMGVNLIAAILVLAGILLSDLAYALVDPRISFD